MWPIKDTHFFKGRIKYWRLNEFISEIQSLLLKVLRMFIWTSLISIVFMPTVEQVIIAEESHRIGNINATMDS